MNAETLFQQLERNAAVIEEAVRGLDEEEARWKQTSESWSIVEVINHLCDEELLDFRTRLDLVLECPDTPWPPINPPRWAVQREYQRRDLEESIARFGALRRQSLRWLRGLESPDWDRTYVHPLFGKISAGDLLTSWVAHDLLHLRQLGRIKYLYTTQVLSSFSARYAGDW